jgi:predicted ATPase/DNA-binding SARP family transcriptional activator
MEFRVLGPLEVEGAPSRSPAGLKERLVLLCLLLEPGRPVAADAILETVWPDADPAAAARSLTVRLANLRRWLAPVAIERFGPGLTLGVEPGQVDAQRFAALVEEGGHDAALGLWRGTPFGELAGAEIAQAEVRRLEELHRRAREGRARALLEAGRAADAVAELERLAAEDPLNEDVARALMLALYRSGRQAAALAAYRRHASALLDLGLEPSAEVRELERAMLAREVAAPAAPAADGATARAARGVPPRRSRFLGRQAHLVRLGELLAGRPLVTVTGVGGTGKTRLAAELADREAGRFPQGVWWCELAPVGLGADVAGAVAEAVGLDPAPGTPTLDHVAEHLAPRRGLLVLDNCEHVLDAAADVVERLLDGCPDLRLLVTSRAPLGVDGEEVVRLGGLELPAGHEGADLRASAAVALFLDRARAAGAGQAAVEQLAATAEICRRLDGSPLAIELAAGRTRSLSPAEIAARLDERFSLLAVSGRRAAARHRTLGAAVDWSYDLLSEPQRLVFERLSVFARGATLDAARDVCTAGAVARHDVDGLLDALVAHSLVQAQDAGGRTVYTMLETLREYAAARLLDRGEHAEARDRHADHFRARAQAMIDAALAWRSSLPFVDEFDDVRAALRWCRDTDASPDRAFTILTPLWGLAPAQHAEDIASVAEEALARWPDVGPLRLHALGTAATARLFSGDAAAAHGLAQTALDLEQEAGETALLARRTIAHLAMYGSHPAAAAQLTADVSARARAAGQDALACECDGFTVQLLHAAGERDEAVALAARMRDEADRLEAPFMICWSRYVSGVVRLEDDPVEARRWLEEAVARGRVAGHHHMVRFSLRALGVAALLEGDHGEAAARLEAALSHDEARTDAASQWTTLSTLALLLAEAGRPHAAAQLLAAAAGWPASPILAGLAERARRRVADALGREEQAAAARSGEALDLEAAKALARAEVGQLTMRSATRVAGPRAPERRPTRTTTS